MLYREVIAVCSEIHTKHINTLCGQNVEFVNVKPGGTHSSHTRNSSCNTKQFACVQTKHLARMFVLRSDDSFQQQTACLTSTKSALLSISFLHFRTVFRSIWIRLFQLSCSSVLRGKYHCVTLSAVDTHIWRHQHLKTRTWQQSC
jgi:hypothetical protein